MNVDHINEIVSELNATIFEQLEDSDNDAIYEIFIEMKTIGGGVILIEFLGVQLWNSENDERNEISEDEYEDLQDYLIRRIRFLLEDLKRVKL